MYHIVCIFTNCKLNNLGLVKRPQATLNKKCVSSTAGGRHYGQSGGLKKKLIADTVFINLSMVENHKIICNKIYSIQAAKLTLVGPVINLVKFSLN